MSVPLFPLPDVVLLPGLVLPLYIFEPRYRELLARVRRTGEPFGITRLLPPLDDGVDFEARVTRFGTLAHLHEVVDHADGTASILVVGGDRFEIEAFERDHSYLSARIRLLPVTLGDPDVVAALSRKVVDGVVNSGRAEALAVRDRLPSDALLQSTLCAALLPLSSDQREEVLQADTVADRFEILATWLPSRTLN